MIINKNIHPNKLPGGGGLKKINIIRTEPWQGKTDSRVASAWRVWEEEGDRGPKWNELNYLLDLQISAQEWPVEKWTREMLSVQARSGMPKMITKSWSWKARPKIIFANAWACNSKRTSPRFKIGGLPSETEGSSGNACTDLQVLLVPSKMSWAKWNSQ